MLARISSFGLRGAEGYPVQVELDLANGLPAFTTVGLPDNAVREARDRVSSALRNSGFQFPLRRITVNLAPAEARKQGTHFDLPIALAVLSASGQLPAGDWSQRYCCAGELALDGTLRPVRGILAMAARARSQGFCGMVVPRENAAEASAAGLPAYGAGALGEVARFLSGDPDSCLSASVPSQACGEELPAALDLCDVRGQILARRALEIAAAGGHHLLLVGPPGAGKSMLARRLPGLLPEMTPGEALEVTRVHSACQVRRGEGLMSRRPFRAPHHSATQAALVGGGPAARPGEVSLAHGGVLFLDELAEFGRAALEALRQPLEDARVTVARVRETVEYPACFTLVAATNPCPCGWRGHPQRACLCTPAAVSRYLSRLSGPLLDRIDVQVEVEALPFADWAGSGRASRGESSADVRARVERARARQRERFAGADFAVNARIPSGELRRHCALDSRGLFLLEGAARKLGLSARSLDRVLRVARTAADLEGAQAVADRHLGEAMQYRSLDRLQP